MARFWIFVKMARTGVTTTLSSRQILVPSARVKRPNKEEAVTSFISRFGKHVEPVGRPEGCEGVVVPAKLPKKLKQKSKKGKGQSQDGQIAQEEIKKEN